MEMERGDGVGGAVLGRCSQIKLDATEIGCGQGRERSQMPEMHKRGSISSVVIGQYGSRSTQPDECKSQSERSRRKKELRIRKSPNWRLWQKVTRSDKK